LQKQPFLVLRLVWVAGWLWALHKVVQLFAIPELCCGLNFKLENNTTYPPLIIFYQRRLLAAAFLFQRPI
jgi:hypothetical protein